MIVRPRTRPLHHQGDSASGQLRGVAAGVQHWRAQEPRQNGERLSRSWFTDVTYSSSRPQLEARGWRILRDSTAELTASDGEIHLTIHAELYPEEPREPDSLNVSITASDAHPDAP